MQQTSRDSLWIPSTYLSGRFFSIEDWLQGIQTMLIVILIPGRKFSPWRTDPCESTFTSPGDKNFKDGKSWSNFLAICSLYFAISIPETQLLKIYSGNKTLLYTSDNQNREPWHTSSKICEQHSSPPIKSNCFLMLPEFILRKAEPTSLTTVSALSPMTFGSPRSWQDFFEAFLAVQALALEAKTSSAVYSAGASSVASRPPSLRTCFYHLMSQRYRIRNNTSSTPRSTALLDVIKHIIRMRAFYIELCIKWRTPP